MALGQAGQQGGLGSINAFQGFGQLGGLAVAEGDGLVATFVTENRGYRSNQFGARVKQRLCVEHFQPGALAVLGADTEGQAEQGIGHVITSCEIG